MGWFGNKRKRPPRQVVMYTRQGCHLCDEAWQLLTDMQAKHALKLTAVDVDSQPDLIQQFGERVPVIVIDGKERFWGRTNRVLLERFLQATDVEDRPKQ
ncbi:MAG TPA: glutaredoxin family protein [Gemmataceae bacterium]|nr:glutaredoxin family protein [Gemmataceae bacterium]